MDLLHVYDVSCPASTPTTAPIEVQTLVAGLYMVTRVTIWIPDGHAGLTGIALAYGHQPVIPVNGTWISANDETLHYDLGRNYPPGVSWSVFLCNGDLQSHGWETRWELTLLAQNESQQATPALTPEAIVAAAQLATAGP